MAKKKKRFYCKSHEAVEGISENCIKMFNLRRKVQNKFGSVHVYVANSQCMSSLATLQTTHFSSVTFQVILVINSAISSGHYSISQKCFQGNPAGCIASLTVSIHSSWTNTLRCFVDFTAIPHIKHMHAATVGRKTPL